MMPAMRLISPALAIAALTLVLAACGGDEGLSKKDLAAKANAICKKSQDEVEKVKRPTEAELQDADKASAFFDKIAPIADQQVKDLKDLSPADSVKADWNDFIAKEDAANDLLQTIKKKAAAKDASGLQDLQKFGGVNDAVEPAAKKVGATSCA